MTRLYELKNGEYARLVEIDHDMNSKKRYESKGILGGKHHFDDIESLGDCVSD